MHVEEPTNERMGDKYSAKRDDGKNNLSDKKDHQEETQTAGETFSDADALKDEIRHLQTENADLKDKFLRSLAETENMKKRFEREKIDLQNYSLEKFTLNLLPILDSFEKAFPESSNTVETNNSELAASLSGISLVKKQLLNVLGQNGLAVVPAQKGEKFDPHLHQAIQRLDVESVEYEQIHTEFAQGYTLHGRLLRPSMVSVAVPTSEKKEN